jgi:hypothetical protein
VAQAECIKSLMDICANTPVHLDSTAPPTTPPPPFALPLEECARLVDALCACATASVMRRIETLKQGKEKEGADELGACLAFVAPPRHCPSPSRDVTLCWFRD